MAAGDVSVDHAAPILTTVAKLRPEDREVDEKILLDAARDLDPDSLRQLCHATLAAAGAALRAAVLPLAQKVGPEDKRTAPQRRADALATLATAAMGFDDLLPTFNGERPAINATLDYQNSPATSKRGLNNWTTARSPSAAYRSARPRHACWPATPTSCRS